MIKGTTSNCTLTNHLIAEFGSRITETCPTIGEGWGKLMKKGNDSHPNMNYIVNCYFSGQTGSITVSGDLVRLTPEP